MTSVAEEYAYVVGVDTHAKTHTYTIVETRTGQTMITDTFPTSEAGLSRALTWVSRHTTSEPLMVVEGIGSYGAILTERAQQVGFLVVEPDRMPAGAKRGKGKSDELDAGRIARSVLASDVTRLRKPRADQGPRDALQVLIAARKTRNIIRTAMINSLTALVRRTPLGVDARRQLTDAQIRTISGWKTRNEALHLATARQEAVYLAHHIMGLTKELVVNKSTIDYLIRSTQYKQLLDEPGVGPICAAKIIIAYGNHDRIHSEASFAALAGVCPIPASSGNTSRHRLNRGGDRQLNSAIHTIVLTRLAHDPETKAYQERRLQEGKTPREIRRCLKRYIVRDLYRLLRRLSGE